MFLIEVPGPRRSPTPKRHSNAAVAGLEVVLIRVVPIMVKHPPTSVAYKVKTCTLKSALGAGFNQPVPVANGRWILDGVDGLGVMITGTWLAGWPGVHHSPRDLVLDGGCGRSP